MAYKIINIITRSFPNNSSSTSNNNLRAYNTLNTNRSCFRTSITRRTTLVPSQVRRSIRISISSSRRRRGHLRSSRSTTCLRSRGGKLSSLTRSIIRWCSKSKRPRPSRPGRLVRSVVVRLMDLQQMTKKTYSQVSTMLTSRRVVDHIVKPRLILVLSSCPEVVEMIFRLSDS